VPVGIPVGRGRGRDGVGGRARGLGAAHAVVGRRHVVVELGAAAKGLAVGDIDRRVARVRRVQVQGEALVGVAVGPGVGLRVVVTGAGFGEDIVVVGRVVVERLPVGDPAHVELQRTQDRGAGTNRAHQTHKWPHARAGRARPPTALHAQAPAAATAPAPGRTESAERFGRRPSIMAFGKMLFFVFLLEFVAIFSSS